MRRVVRFSSRTSSAASSAASVRTTDGSDVRNDSAAAVRLPAVDDPDEGFHRAQLVHPPTLLRFSQ